MGARPVCTATCLVPSTNKTERGDMLAECVILWPNALTERVLPAASPAREGRSWAASLPAVTRAKRSLPSSDLNGRAASGGDVPSREAVSLATRGTEWARRARHPPGQTRWYRGIQPSLGNAHARGRFFVTEPGRTFAAPGGSNRRGKWMRERRKGRHESD